VAAGFLYTSNSSIGHFEWLVCDKNAARSDKNLAIQMVSEGILELAKESKATTIITSFDNTQKNAKHLEDLYKYLGFQVVGSNMTMMVKSDNLNHFKCEDVLNG